MTTPLGHGIPAELIAQSSAFVESATVFDHIGQRLRENAPTLVLVAEPGFGKTSIAVRLVQISVGTAPPPRGFGPDWLHAWHFCQARRYESLDPRAVLERLAGQLCRTVPGYAEEIARSVGDTNITVTQTIAGGVRDSTVMGIGKLVLPATDPRQLLQEFFRAPLARLGRDVTVLVDAIDESDEQSDPTTSLAWLLATIQNDPIPYLRLVLTSRNGTTARRFTSGILELRDIRSAGADDVRAYTLRRLRSAGVAEPTQLACRISDAANGNFLYAVHKVDEYLNEPTSDALALPMGLAELYQAFLSRRAAADVDRWHSSIRRVLALLVQSRGEGFTCQQLAIISGLAPSVVDEALERCSPYLSGEGDGPFVPFHEALRDYLRMPSQHGIRPLEATRQIVEALRHTVADPHAVTHLLGYLADYDRLAGHEDTTALQAIEETLTNPAYLHARLAATSVESLLAEISALQRHTGESASLDTIHGVLTRQAHNLRQWDPDEQPTLALQQIRYECASSGVPELLAVGAGEQEPALDVQWSAASEGTLQLSHTFISTESHFAAMALSPDSNTVAFAYFSYDASRIDLHEVKTGLVVSSFSCAGRVNEMRFGTDDQKLLLRRVDNTVVACNIVTGEEGPATRDDVLPILEKSPTKLPAYVDAVTDYEDRPVAAATPDGHYLVALCQQLRREFIAVWDTRRREIIGVHFGGKHIDSLAITADGKKVIVACLIGNSYILSAPRTAHTSRNGHHVAVEAVALRGDRAVSVGEDGTVKVRDSTSGRPGLTVIGSPHVESIDITPDGEKCIMGNSRGHIEVLDLDLQLVVRKLAMYGVPIDEQWKARNGACEPVLPPMGFDKPYPLPRPIKFYDDDESVALAVDVSADGRLAVTGTSDGVLRTWALDTGNLVREFTRDGCFIPSARFTQDGRHIVTVSQLGGLLIPRLVSVDMWSIASGDRVDQLWPPPDGLPYDIICDGAVAITRDGHYLATTSGSHTLVVHDLSRRREVGRLTLHGRHPCLAIDGRRVLVGTDRGEVLLIRFG